MLTKGRLGAKFIAAADAAALVPDGASVYYSGVGAVQHPRALTTALRDRFLQTGSPRGLTFVSQCNAGMGAKDHAFAHEGLIAAFITSNLMNHTYPQLAELILSNQIEGYFLPMGVLIEMMRAAAGGRLGVFTDVGVGSFVDPRVQGPGLNNRSQRTLVEPMTLAGQDLLHYRPLPIDVAFLKGSIADAEGNISFEDEALKLTSKVVALATRNAGGRVIAQVREVVEAGALDPHKVELPSFLVDAVVVEPNQWQIEASVQLDPRLAGHRRGALEPLPAFPLDDEKVIVRRAAFELFPGAVVNCGYRIPQVLLPRLCAEEGVEGRVTFSIEQGALGGRNPGGILHWNPTAWMRSDEVFTLYHGGGLDRAFLGFAQSDAAGDINLTRIGDYLPGPGGAIDIAHRTPEVVFCGTFTTGNADIRVEDGRLTIAREGSVKKFVRKVDQVTFSNRERLRKGQRFTIVTERAVFDLVAGGLLLREIAPGISIERDILSLSDVPITVPAEVATMDARIFREGLMGLGGILDAAATAPERRRTDADARPLAAAAAVRGRDG
jgi:propionate CoA-transferase